MFTFFTVLMAIMLIFSPVALIIAIVKTVRKRATKKRWWFIFLAAIVLFIIFGAIAGVLECDHEYELVDETEPTCTERGEAVYYCEKCGRQRKERLDELGHDMQLTKSIEPTVDTEGEIVYRCEKCGYEEIEKIEKTSTPSPTATPTPMPILTPTTSPTSTPTPAPQESESSTVILGEWKNLYNSPRSEGGALIKLSGEAVAVRDIGDWTVIGIKFELPDGERYWFAAVEKSENNVDSLRGKQVDVYGEYQRLLNGTPYILAYRYEVDGVEKMVSYSESSNLVLQREAMSFSERESTRPRNLPSDVWLDENVEAYIVELGPLIFNDGVMFIPIISGTLEWNYLTETERGRFAQKVIQYCLGIAKSEYGFSDTSVECSIEDGAGGKSLIFVGVDRGSITIYEPGNNMPIERWGWDRRLE